MANKGSAAFSERKNFAKAESVRRSDNGLAGRQLKVNDRSNIAMNESERRAGSAIYAHDRTFQISFSGFPF